MMTTELVQLKQDDKLPDTFPENGQYMLTRLLLYQYYQYPQMRMRKLSIIKSMIFQMRDAPVYISAAKRCSI